MSKHDYSDVQGALERIEGKLDALALLVGTFMKKVNSVDGRIWGLALLALGALLAACLR